MLCERRYLDGALPLAQYLMAAHLKMDPMVLKRVTELWEMRRSMMQHGKAKQRSKTKTHIMGLTRPDVQYRDISY